MSTIDPDQNKELSASIREMTSGLHQAGLMPENTAREIEELLGDPIADIVLSKSDFAHFVETLNNPQPPTAALIAARKRYRDIQAPSENEDGWGYGRYTVSRATAMPEIPRNMGLRGGATCRGSAHHARYAQY